MSSTLQTFIPVLDGTNYQQWAAAMQSYLMSQGQWKVCIVPPPTKEELNVTAASTSTTASAKASTKEAEKPTSNSADLEETAMKGLGNIRLCLHHTIGYQYADEESPYRLWNQLRTKYSNPGASRAFIEFKAMMDTRIPDNQDPYPSVDKILTHFMCLKDISFELSEKIQVMMLLVKCPSMMETIV